MLRRSLAWSGALTVMAITATLVILDVTDTGFHRYWSRHSFTSSVLSGVLVLLLTVLIVDRVADMRRVRNQSRAIAAQAAVILAQAVRTADAIGDASSRQDRDDASNQLHTYTQMLLSSAPVLIDASMSRAFLETAQRTAVQMYRALRRSADDGKEQTKAQLDEAVKRLRADAAPLVAVLNRQQQDAVSAGEDELASDQAGSPRDRQRPRV